MISKIFSVLVTLLVDKQINECSMDADHIKLKVDCGDEEFVITAAYRKKIGEQDVVL